MSPQPIRRRRPRRATGLRRQERDGRHHGVEYERERAGVIRRSSDDILAEVGPFIFFLTVFPSRMYVRVHVGSYETLNSRKLLPVLEL